MPYSFIGAISLAFLTLLSAQQASSTLILNNG
jgi:hypothetical protein